MPRHVEQGSFILRLIWNPSFPLKAYYYLRSLYYTYRWSVCQNYGNMLQPAEHYKRTKHYNTTVVRPNLFDADVDTQKSEWNIFPTFMTRLLLYFFHKHAFNVRYLSYHIIYLPRHVAKSHRSPNIPSCIRTALTSNLQLITRAVSPRCDP